MTSYFKQPNYRNRKLLDLAKGVPYCLSCGKPNDGTIVAAHSNQLRDGKGKGLKASDAAIAFLCYKCHSEIDSGPHLNKQEKIEVWEEAHRASIKWLIENEHLIVNSKL